MELRSEGANRQPGERVKGELSNREKGKCWYDVSKREAGQVHRGPGVEDSSERGVWA